MELTVLQAVCWVIAYMLVVVIINILLNLAGVTGTRAEAEACAWFWPLSVPIIFIIMMVATVAWAADVGTSSSQARYNAWRCEMGDHVYHKESFNLTLAEREGGYKTVKRCKHCGHQKFWR